MLSHFRRLRKITVLCDIYFITVTYIYALVNSHQLEITITCLLFWDLVSGINISVPSEGQSILAGESPVMVETRAM
jgi:hypothetical protein